MKTESNKTEESKGKKRSRFHPIRCTFKWYLSQKGRGVEVRIEGSDYLWQWIEPPASWGSGWLWKPEERNGVKGVLFTRQMSYALEGTLAIQVPLGRLQAFGKHLFAVGGMYLDNLKYQDEEYNREMQRHSEALERIQKKHDAILMDATGCWTEDQVFDAVWEMKEQEEAGKGNREAHRMPEE